MAGLLLSVLLPGLTSDNTRLTEILDKRLTLSPHKLERWHAYFLLLAIYIYKGDTSLGYANGEQKCWLAITKLASLK